MKRLISPLLLVILLVLALSDLTSAHSPSPIAADSAANKVSAHFHTFWNFESSEDTFVNSEVIGWKCWQVSMTNSPDEMGAALAALTLNLESTLAFENFQSENLVTSGPPTYEWSFGDVPEGSGADAWVDLLSSPLSVTFTPGFDASRSADKTEFTGPDTQTITITLTPREATKGFGILVQAFEDDVVNPVITSPTSGDGIHLSPDGHLLHINPTGLALNIPWTIAVTIQVTPKVPKVEYIPCILIGWGETVASGSNSGSFISHPVGDPADNVGTWTWSAEGTYEWNWEESLSKRVVWLSSSRVMGNRIHMGFTHEFHYEVSGDAFVNAEVIGKEWWRTNLQNSPDETGAPVIRSNVTLNTELEFDEVETDKLTRMGPPVYEWYLGDMVEEPERQGWGWDAFVGFYNASTKFSPGVDVSRSFDKTIFTAPDTQTMTLTVTPREEWVKEVSIFVHADEYDIVNPVIMSISHTGGGEVSIMEDGHRSGVERIPVELNTPLIITYTLQVTPKVSEVEYSPITGIHLYRPGVLDSGTNSGNSVSYTNEAGTWTWSAEGDYYWQWTAGTPDYHVFWHERARQPGADHEIPSTPETSQPETSQAISWLFVIGLTAGVVVAGSVIYFFIRTRRKRASL